VFTAHLVVCGAASIVGRAGPGERECDEDLTDLSRGRNLAGDGGEVYLREIVSVAVA
jgi:hypothetical protein